MLLSFWPLRPRFLHSGAGPSDDGHSGKHTFYIKGIKWTTPLPITPLSPFSSPPDQSTSMFMQSLIQEWSGRVFWYAACCHYGNGPFQWQTWQRNELLHNMHSTTSCMKWLGAGCGVMKFTVDVPGACHLLFCRKSVQHHVSLIRSSDVPGCQKKKVSRCAVNSQASTVSLRLVMPYWHRQVACWRYFAGT